MLAAIKDQGGRPDAMTDNTLLARIKLALAAANEAQQTTTTVQAELVSRIWWTLMAWLRGEFRTTRV
jgi:hypothetical protein